jgi:hypothetical protein
LKSIVDVRRGGMELYSATECRVQQGSGEPLATALPTVAAVKRVARHRGVRLVPLEEVLDGYAGLAQRRWTAWRRKQRLDDRLLERFGEVLDTVIAFADAVMRGTADARTWSGTDRVWRAGTWGNGSRKQSERSGNAGSDRTSWHDSPDAVVSFPWYTT